MMTDLRLPAACTLVQADDLARSLRAALSEPGADLHLDATDLVEGDISLLQLIIATQHGCAAAGRGLRLTPSPALSDLARRAGLDATATGLSLPP